MKTLNEVKILTLYPKRILKLENNKNIDWLLNQGFAKISYLS